MITKKQAQQIAYSHVSLVKREFTHISTEEKVDYFTKDFQGYISIWRDKRLPEYEIRVVCNKFADRWEIDRYLLGYKLRPTETLHQGMLRVWCKGNVGMEWKLAEMQSLLWQGKPLGKLTRLSKLLKDSLLKEKLAEFPILYSSQRIHPVNGLVEFSAFTSTSLKQCFDTFAKSDSACYILKNGRGYDLSKLNPNEKEVLLLPNTKWKVLSQKTERVTKFIEEVTWDSDPEIITWNLPLYEVEPFN